MSVHAVWTACPLQRLALMTEQTKKNDKALSEKRLHLLSKEMEDATNEFLLKLAQLEKLLPRVNE